MWERRRWGDFTFVTGEFRNFSLLREKLDKKQYVWKD